MRTTLHNCLRRRPGTLTPATRSRPCSSCTFLLIVHPHLLQCHSLICHSVPGTVWKSSTGRVLSISFSQRDTGTAECHSSQPWSRSPQVWADVLQAHPSTRAPANTTLTHDAIGALSDPIQLLKLLHAPAFPQLEPNSHITAKGSLSGAALSSFSPTFPQCYNLDSRQQSK